jgi:hypothetical protein
MTQRWTLQGEQAASYAKAVAPSLEAVVAEGMEKPSGRWWMRFIAIAANGRPVDGQPGK